MTLEELAGHVTSGLGERIASHRISLGELSLQTESAHLLDVLSFLRDDPQCAFRTFIDLAGVDYPDRSRRFEVVYHLLSMTKNRRVRLRVMTSAEIAVPSIRSLFPCADWYEREAFDMYGILFDGHPDLRRILTDYGFEGFPLRKEFPLSGHVELRYDDVEKRVVYEPVRLVQDFRNFDYLSPWEGMDRLLPGDEKAR